MTFRALAQLLLRIGIDSKDMKRALLIAVGTIGGFALNVVGLGLLGS